MQLLPQSQGAASKGLKELPSNLFLEGEKEEGQLVIQYGDSWFQDLLADLGGLGGSALDFPVFCSDGIAWSNRLNFHIKHNLLNNFIILGCFWPLCPHF